MVLDVSLASAEHLIAQKLTVKLVSEVKSILSEARSLLSVARSLLSEHGKVC
jgi:hypothetical protein